MKTFIVILLIAAAALPGSGATLGFIPPAQTVMLGQQASVDVVVTDRGRDRIGAFDFAVEYDPTLLDVASIVFGSQLGFELDQLTFLDLTTPGIIGLTEVSLELPETLELLQPDDTVVLATIVFDTLQTGTSPLRFSRDPLVLSNSFGQELAVTPTEGSITIAAVPEPASMLLCGAALVLVAAGLRRRG